LFQTLTLFFLCLNYWNTKRKKNNQNYNGFTNLEEQIMKSLYFLLVVSILVSNAVFATGESALSGFGQIKTDSSGFSIPKVRLILCGPLETGINRVKVSYTTYTDFDNAGKPELGFAQINFQFSEEWMPKLIVGRTLDPITYQFPAPFALPVLNYPASSFNHPCGLGIFIQEEYKGIWGMLGATNGTAKFKDDNNSLDCTGRLTYDLPFNLTPGVICWRGKQPDGYRRITGGDLTWKSGKFWVNGGQNTINYNGHKTGRWLFATVDIFKYLQLVGLVESLQNSGKTTIGRSAGVNFSPSPKTVVRLNLYKLAVNEKSGWGILFQQKF